MFKSNTISFVHMLRMERLNWCIMKLADFLTKGLNGPTLANLVKRIQVLPNTTQHAGELEMHRRCQSTVPCLISTIYLLFVSTT